MLSLKTNNLPFVPIVTIIIFLSGCSGGHSNPHTKQLILPTIVEYSPKTQLALDTEIKTKSCTIADKFITDYGIMRDETREALK